MNKKQVAELSLAIQTYLEKNTPCPGGKCHCGGLLYRKVNSLFRNKFYYNSPECDKCGRVYITCAATRTKGEKEFMEMLNTPITI